MMDRFTCDNQVFCILIFLFYYVCFQVNCSSSFSSSSANTTHYLCPMKQSSALLQFKSGISVGSSPQVDCDQNSSSKTLSWTEDSDCCAWDGVTCDEITGNVIGLDLDCSWLEGTIQDNSSLFHLSHLQWLNLAFNDFNPSQISPEFGRLTELTQLNLSYSRFDGLVPSEISRLSKLTLLDLSTLNSSGSLTINQQNFDLLVHNLTKLRVLDLEQINMSSVKSFSLLNLSWSMMVLNLGDTGIQGKFPEEILHLTNLQELYLHFNRDLTGYLPKTNWSSNLRVLDLSSSNFKGEIPDSIENLQFLEVLSIVACNFAGSIPISIGNLSRVTELKLAVNHFTGTLPSSMSKLPKVTYISLSGNMLTGQIPDIFVNFSHSPKWPYRANVLPCLTTLDLSENLFNRKVASWLFTLPSLNHIDLSHNKLAGPIEPFNSANSVQDIDLHDNEISGSIPSSIFELVNLTYLDISSNNLSGTLKFDMLSRLKSLEFLDISNNSPLSFTSSTCINCSLPNLESLIFSSCNVSEFPGFLRTSEKLSYLDLSNNKIHGGITKSESEGWKSLDALDLSNNFLTYIEQYPWKNIVSLNLQNNMIQGSILLPPPSIAEFIVSNNKLTGKIPPSICDLSDLSLLDLSNNSLSGYIPSCLANHTERIMLHLQRNNLEGSIPDTFVNGCLLKSLDLSDNKLEGPLPRSLVHCFNLVVINLRNNKISGPFPCWLGTFSELVVLDVRSNRFYGPLCVSRNTFPFVSLQIVFLSQNEFTGSLPGRFFASMEELMNKNIMSTEEIPVYDYLNVTTKGGEYIVNRRGLTFFTCIDLSRNFFRGEIPEIFGKFKSLAVLNLSHNSLTGNIPLSLSNMTALESLDLSFNRLDGRIPEQLTNVTTLEVLNLSYNHLWGHIPQGNQFNTFGNDSFIGNNGLCGEPLSVKCDTNAGEAQPTPVSQEEDETASGFDWKIAKMGYASGVLIGMSIGYIVFSTGKPWWFVKIVEEKLMKKVRRSGQRRKRNK